MRVARDRDSGWGNRDGAGEEGSGQRAAGSGGGPARPELSGEFRGHLRRGEIPRRFEMSEGGEWRPRSGD